METDIGNPIDYDPSIDPLNNEKNEEDIQDDHRTIMTTLCKSTDIHPQQAEN